MRTPTGKVMWCGAEDDEQEQIILWSENMKSMYPELDLLYHVPNGGKRTKSEAARFKRMGVKSGVPDLVLPVARGGYAGAYVELKVGPNKATKNQEHWISKLEEQGYYTAVCYGSIEAEETIEWYLQQGKTVLMTMEQCGRKDAERGL